MIYIISKLKKEKNIFYLKKVTWIKKRIPCSSAYVSVQGGCDSQITKLMGVIRPMPSLGVHRIRLDKLGGSRSIYFDVSPIELTPQNL